MWLRGRISALPEEISSFSTQHLWFRKASSKLKEFHLRSWRSNQSREGPGLDLAEGNFICSLVWRKGCGIVAEHLLSIQKALVSVPGIATCKEQVISDRKDLH